MVLALLVPMVGPASATSTYSANTVQNVSAGQWYADPAGIFNRIIVEVAAGSLSGPATIRMSLPTDFTTNLTGQVPTFSTGTNQVANVTLTPVGTAVASPSGINTYREWDITVTPQASADKGLFYLDMSSFRVPSGKTGNIEATFDAPPGSPMSSGKVLVAQIGTGIVTLAMDDVKIITTAGGAIGDLLIKEDRAGALASTTAAVKVKLPNGFTWNKAGAASSLIWSTGDAAVLPTAAQLTLQDNDRTLVIPNPKGAASSSATYYRISGLRINVDESIAKSGDIVATVSGDSTIATSSLTVGQLGDYSVTVSAFGEPKEVRAGRADEEIGKIAIEESVAGSLVGGRTITLQLTGGAVWRDFPTIDAANSKNTNALTWSVVGTTGDTIKATVTASADAAKYVLEKGTIDLSAAASGDIKVIVGGTAGASGEVLVAKAVKPASISIEGTPAQLVAGEKGQALPTIVVTENKAEGIDATGANNLLRLEFPMDVFPSLPSKVEVTKGDLVIDQNSISRNVTADGRWYVEVRIRSTSSVPSEIKFSGIKVDLYRTMPEGPLNVALKGPAVVQTAGAFPGYTSIAVTKVADVVTPAPTEQKAKAVFKIGDTKFTVNGKEQTMDVAPYIKDGRTFLPVRYVAQALGVSESNILWNAADQTVVLMKGDRVVKLQIGSTTMYINGVTFTMDVAPELVEPGRTMLPFRWVAQALGATVEWDAATQSVTMTL
jgi:hypothetical protein